MKKNFIVIICLLGGFICFCINFFFEWMITLDEETAVPFYQWIITKEGLLIVLDGVSDLGICLIGSAIFMVCVQWVINKDEEQKNKEIEIEKMRFVVSTEMRTNPKQMLSTLKNSGSINSALFNDQFFGGCDFSNLILDNIDFSGSNLTNSNFSNSSLIGASFVNCTTKNINISDAKLAFSNLKNSGLPDDSLMKAYSLWNAILPDGNKYDGRFELKGDVIEASKLGFDIVNNEEQKKSFYGLETLQCNI